MQVINWGLIKHPFNWLTIVLMVMIAGAFFHFLSLHLTQMQNSNTGVN